MGSGISQLPEKLSREDLEQFCGEKFNEDLYESNKDADGFVSLEVLIQFSKETDCFLSHDWGVDGHGRKNHDRVARINDLLKENGINTWFDAEKMTGNIIEKMCEGIEYTKCILVFITNNYINKVGGPNGKDNCKREFNHAINFHGPEKMIAVVMEESVKTTKWKGPVGMNLGGLLYIDMSTDELLESNINELVEGIKKHLTLKKVKPKIVKQTIVVPKKQESTTKVKEEKGTTESKEYKELHTWLKANVDMLESRFDVTTRFLIELGISSVKRLIKKYEKDEDFLANSKIDSEDIEEIISAINKEKDGPEEQIKEESWAPEEEEDQDRDQDQEEGNEEHDFIPGLNCGNCEESIFLLPKRTWPDNWGCDYRNHRGENYCFASDDPLYGCQNVYTCNWGVCQTCAERVVEGNDQEYNEELEYIRESGCLCACGRGLQMTEIECGNYSCDWYFHNDDEDNYFEGGTHVPLACCENTLESKENSECGTTICPTCFERIQSYNI